MFVPNSTAVNDSSRRDGRDLVDSLDDLLIAVDVEIVLVVEIRSRQPGLDRRELRRVEIAVGISR